MTTRFPTNYLKAALILGPILFLFWIGMLVAGPIYNVWAREQHGRAELAEAEWSKQIAIEEAKAKLESEKLNALAEVERAKGLAASQDIIATTLSENYLRYLYIQHLDKGTNKEVIYVPTEGGLPILEAGKR